MGFIDESAHTGSNYLDPRQPFFVVAAAGAWPSCDCRGGRGAGGGGSRFGSIKGVECVAIAGLRQEAGFGCTHLHAAQDLIPARAASCPSKSALEWNQMHPETKKAAAHSQRYAVVGGAACDVMFNEMTDHLQGTEARGRAAALAGHSEKV